MPDIYEYEFDCSQCGKHVKMSSINPDETTLCFDCERLLANIAEGYPTKQCKTCGCTIAPRRAEVEYCSICGHIAYCDSYEDAYADAIEFLRTHVSANSYMWHTGGGCMCIGIQGDGYQLLVGDDDGPLSPRPDQTGWGVSVQDNECERLDGGGEDENDFVSDPSLEALGTLMERFIAHIRADLDVTDFSYGTAD